MLKWFPILKRRPGAKELSAAAVFVCLCLFLLYSQDRITFGGQKHIKQPLTYLGYDWSPSPNGQAPHEIDKLITDAFEQHQKALDRRTFSLEDGAAAYRERRGRHPPPGFDVWYLKALKYDAFIVEDFFDQIYEDIEPFWGVEPSQMRYGAAEWDAMLSVRNGKAMPVKQQRHRSQTWNDMLAVLAGYLPDLEFVVNPLDEPRVVSNFEDVNAAILEAATSRERMKAHSISEISQNSSHPFAIESNASPPKWSTGKETWPEYYRGCELTTMRRDVAYIDNIPVRNWTASKDICARPMLAQMHGALLAPATAVFYQDLVPVFSSAKLRTNNDILLPPPSYYAEDALFSTKNWFGDASTRYKWLDKFDALVWRGKATGGTTQPETWEHFQRHRFVSMMNSSDVAANAKLIHTEDGLDKSTVLSADESTISQWLSSTADVAFTSLFCDGARSSESVCEALNRRYTLGAEVPMAKEYQWKYLPDIDGNSLSGRFRAFLRSNSAPLKSTIFKEWHDSRLAPWVHFIPIDMTFRDLWAVMAYFLGFEGTAGHDEQGHYIAEAGRQWAERVLRREDMLLYMHRALLEYARVSSEQRERMGFVADLMV